MSAELLRHLAQRYTFDSTPAFADLGVYHVRFDALTGRLAVEHRLHEAVLRGERVALVAASGSGKSSVVAHVLGPAVDKVAPIVVPVRAVTDVGAASPARIADEVLALLRRYADEVLALTDRQREAAAAASGEHRRVTLTNRRSGGVTLALPWLRPALGIEISRQTEHHELVTLREKSEILDQLLGTIARDGLQPVLVFDDSDRWLGSTAAEVVRPFFGEVVRWLADLRTAVVVAVHDRYFDEVPRREVLQYLDTAVELPRLTSTGQLTRILDHRIEANVAETDLSGARAGDCFEPAALEAVHDEYAAGVSLRRVIQLCHAALNEAVERPGASIVTAADVTSAANAG